MTLKFYKSKLILAVLLLFVLVVMAACGDTPAETTENTTTAPKTTSSVATTVPTITTTVPVTTTTSEAPETLPPVESEINAIRETAHWQPVHRMNPITRQKDSDGSVSYVWSLTIEIADGLFPPLGIIYSESPDGHGMALINPEDVSVYIKDMMNDSDYTKYSIIPSSWKTARGCDIWFEAEGFVPSADGQYDMYFVFTLPDDKNETLYPGERAYIWAEGESWSYWVPSVMETSLEASLTQSFPCALVSHNQKYSIEHTNGYANGTPPANFPTSPFSFTISNADGLFATEEAWQAIDAEGACAYVMGGIDTEFTRYEVDYMLVEGQSDMWFTLKDFTPIAGETYEIYLFFMAGAGASHEYCWHYVYANDWIAGAPIDPDAWKEKVDVRIYERWDELYFRAHDAYEILIRVKDVHDVGQRNAEASFAEQYGFEYNEDWLKYLKSDPYNFVLFIKSQDEIEAWAKLEEVDKITCNFRYIA